MNRFKAVQGCLDNLPRKNYLEIGVCFGSVFGYVKCEQKIGVDPKFRIPRWVRRRAQSRAMATHYFEMESNEFFATQSQILAKIGGIDVALVDGQHTYEQSLRDVNNTLDYLHDNGVIVIHDCNPNSATVAAPAVSYEDFRRRYGWWRNAWSGDVWKTIVHLRSLRDDLDVAVLDCDFGLGIVRKGRPNSRLNYTASQIATLTYSDLAAKRQQLLNLKPPAYFNEVLTSQGLRP